MINLTTPTTNTIKPLVDQVIDISKLQIILAGGM